MTHPELIAARACCPEHHDPSSQRFWDESHERLDDLLAALQATQEDNGPPEPGDSEGTRMSKTAITAEPGIPMIITTRDFDAPRDLVFRAYTDPGLLVQWLGPRDLTTTVDRYEARNGGTWRYLQTDAQGNTYGFHGVFHGDPSPDGIVQTFEFEGRARSCRPADRDPDRARRQDAGAHGLGLPVSG